MSALQRYTQELFGTNAGANQMAQYGSFLTTPMLYSGATITPAIIQSLSNFLSGLYGAAGGAYSPTIQDQNSLFYLAFYQLAYLFQQGIASWDSGTNYFIGSLAQDGAGNVYISKTNNNLNNALSDVANWDPEIIKPTQQIFTTAGGGTYTLPTSPRKPLYIRVQMVAGGGGGGGSSTVSVGPGNNGTGGGNGQFGPDIVVGGGGGGISTGPGAGGTASFSGTGVTGHAFSGQAGSDGSFGTTAVGGTPSLTMVGGNGGASTFSGAGGGGGFNAPNGQDAVVNTGSGGSGAGIFINSAGTTGQSGAGGGGGGYVDVLITAPNSTYAYTVGDFGGAGSAGAGGGTAGNGAKGIIIVTEFYQ